MASARTLHLGLLARHCRHGQTSLFTPACVHRRGSLPWYRDAPAPVYDGHSISSPPHEAGEVLIAPHLATLAPGPVGGPLARTVLGRDKGTPHKASKGSDRREGDLTCKGAPPKAPQVGCRA